MPLPPRARPAPRRPARKRAGLSLIETTALVSLSGVLLAAFVPTFVRHVRLSKIVEATEQLELMHRGAASYYAASHRLDKRLLTGCLPSSAGPYPALPSQDPVLVDFSVDEAGRATWAALGLEPQPLRYAYSVSTTVPGCGTHPRDGRAVTVFRAEGDLDNDGERSLLERSAVLSADQHELVPAPPLRVERRVE